MNNAAQGIEEFLEIMGPGRLKDAQDSLAILQTLEMKNEESVVDLRHFLSSCLPNSISGAERRALLLNQDWRFKLDCAWSCYELTNDEEDLLHSIQLILATEPDCSLESLLSHQEQVSLAVDHDISFLLRSPAESKTVIERERRQSEARAKSFRRWLRNDEPSSFNASDCCEPIDDTRGDGEKEQSTGKFVWQTIDNSLVYSVDLTRPRNKGQKVAAFDMDNTLIKTKSGAKFARGANDWQWWSTEVPEYLRKLETEGYRLAIVTNQAGVGRGQTTSLTNVQRKIENMAAEAGVKFDVFIATQKDVFRKPSPEIWTRYKSMLGPRTLAWNQSFYCGDAAGRDDDFSDSDRKFAQNAGLSFYFPEGVFNKQFFLTF